MMTVTDLEEKVKKAQDAVEKAKRTIQRHEQQVQKKLSAIREHEWDENDRYARLGMDDYNESYWAVCEYSYKLQDLKNARKKLAEKERILDNWKSRLEVSKGRERVFLTQVPECMKAMQHELVADWDAFDIERRERLTGKYRELGYRSFTEHYAKADYLFMHQTDEEIHKANVDAAERLVMDLYNRISVVTGEVTDWSGIRYGGKALNGVVTGKLGTVKVESVLAGGYNIQRRHIRVLVHELGKTRKQGRASEYER